MENKHEVIENAKTHMKVFGIFFITLDSKLIRYSNQLALPASLTLHA